MRWGDVAGHPLCSHGNLVCVPSVRARWAQPETGALWRGWLWGCERGPGGQGGIWGCRADLGGMRRGVWPERAVAEGESWGRRGPLGPGGAARRPRDHPGCAGGCCAGTPGRGASGDAGGSWPLALCPAGPLKRTGWGLVPAPWVSWRWGTPARIPALQPGPGLPLDQVSQIQRRVFRVRTRPVSFLRNRGCRRGHHQRRVTLWGVGEAAGGSNLCGVWDHPARAGEGVFLQEPREREPARPLLPPAGSRE